MPQNIPPEDASFQAFLNRSKDASQDGEFVRGEELKSALASFSEFVDRSLESEDPRKRITQVVVLYRSPSYFGVAPLIEPITMEDTLLDIGMINNGAQILSAMEFTDKEDNLGDDE